MLGPGAASIGVPAPGPLAFEHRVRRGPPRSTESLTVTPRRRRHPALAPSLPPLAAGALGGTAATPATTSAAPAAVR